MIFFVALKVFPFNQVLDSAFDQHRIRHKTGFQLVCYLNFLYLIEFAEPSKMNPFGTSGSVRIDFKNSSVRFTARTDRKNFEPFFKFYGLSIYRVSQLSIYINYLALSLEPWRIF